MADVVKLSERMPRGPRKSVSQPVDAKILLFTGVRYEYPPMPGKFDGKTPSETRKH